MKTLTILLLLSLTLNAHGAPRKNLPTLAGQCKAKAIEAAQSVVVINKDVEFEDSDIEAYEDEKNVYSFNYNDGGGDICFFRAYVTIKPTRVDQKKNQVIDCEIVAAEDDGQPNCG